MAFLSSNPSFCLFFLLSLLSFNLIPPTVKSEQPISSSLLCLPSDGGSDAGESLICPRIDSDETGSCPVKCFRPDPVCGADGVTYWCGCSDAHCAGTKVVKSGFCEVGNGGSGPLSGQAFLLVHLVWLIVLGFALLCGFL